MADLNTLAVAGAATFAAPGSDPKAPARLQDLGWVSAPPASKTAVGRVGQYHSNGNYFWICYATNLWARYPIVSDWP